jgi:hypothetical protein
MTQDDRKILRFAAEHDGVLSGQVAVLLGSTDAQATEHLVELAAQGLTRHHRTHHDQPGYHQITSRGLDTIGSRLPEPRTETLADYRTRLSLPWLTLAAIGGRFGPVKRAMTARVMRHHDANIRGGTVPPDPHDPPTETRQLYGIRLGAGVDGTVATHYPHLAVVAATNHRIAFQVQLRTPSVRRLQAEITAYASDPRIDVAVYLVEELTVGRTIEDSATNLGLNDAIRVQRVTLDATLTTSAQ